VKLYQADLHCMVSMHDWPLLLLQALVQAMWPWYSTGLDDVSGPSANNAHNEEEVQLEPMW